MFREDMLMNVENRWGYIHNEIAERRLTCTVYPNHIVFVSLLELKVRKCPNFVYS